MFVARLSGAILIERCKHKTTLVRIVILLWSFTSLPCILQHRKTRVWTSNFIIFIHTGVSVLVYLIWLKF